MTEELEYAPGRLIVNRIVRPRLTCSWLADTFARIPDYKITKGNDLLPWCWNG